MIIQTPWCSVAKRICENRLDNTNESKEHLAPGSAIVNQVGEHTVMYEENFLMFLTTRLPKPRFPSELLTKTVLVNWVVTLSEVSERLLSLTALHERPELERERKDLTMRRVRDDYELQEVERRVVEVIASAGGAGPETNKQNKYKKKRITNEIIIIILKKKMKNKKVMMMMMIMNIQKTNKLSTIKIQKSKIKQNSKDFP